MDSVAAFLRPLYQDLDGVSRMDEVERIAGLARSLYVSDDRDFELLLSFHRLGNWLDKVGNLTRTALATGISEGQLHRVAASIRRLADPQSDAECAVAAATIIDAAGVRGLAERLTRARREGLTIDDVARAELHEVAIPEWFPAEARTMLMERVEARRAVCEAIMSEGRPPARTPSPR
ncbi:MAG TPA: hypothetical protein VI670_16200 [Thermoanaerobaculia bacterium]|jgi:hypothetical protein